MKNSVQLPKNGHKLNKNERKAIIERFVNEHKGLPTVTELKELLNCSRGAASYEINDYIILNTRKLLEDRIIDGARLAQAKNSKIRRSSVIQDKVVSTERKTVNIRFGKGVNLDKWNKISRIAAFLVSIAIWWVSIKFSTEGFNFQVPDLVWIGWTLGICITVIEIVFNKEGVERNLTLWVIGAMAYAYGMWTNVEGIWLAQGSVPGFAHWVFPIILGVVIEWVPEVLFVWALLGEVTREGDFLGSVIRMFSNKGTPWESSSFAPKSRPYIPLKNLSNKPDYRANKPRYPATKNNLDLMKNKPNWNDTDDDDYRL